VSSPAPSFSPLPEIRAFFRDQGKFVLTFAGYSGAGYEEPERLARLVGELLEERAPSETLINIGVTADGIGAVYEWAKWRGFTTSGIVSAVALRYGATVSPWCDHPFFVEDESWGGLIEGTLSPTSEAMVEVSDLMVAFGGGDIARDEMAEMRRRGKPIRFVPADMNHAIARAKAAGKGQPEPDAAFLRGSAHGVFATD